RPELVQGIIAGGPEALWKSVEGAEDLAEEGACAVIERGVRPGDVLCGITASGRTPFVLGALEQAREAGARTILLTCNPSRKRAGKPWNVEIDLPTGAEILAGSTRLKAGTATKLALNIISTCAMIRLGKTHGNKMIDFAASNSKLRDRAIRLVSGARGISYEQAESLLESHAWRVRDCLPV
ncbi:MAG TPA: N-acetylmuramic acid 6-phosphate etherase, partial [Chthoniobacteraceae bacterium]|nr:N-acetylmuramic acid 6-phosphate etherase [Chthoniobacteraceae bacterium]